MIDRAAMDAELEALNAKMRADHETARAELDAAIKAANDAYAAKLLQISDDYQLQADAIRKKYIALAEAGSSGSTSDPAAGSGAGAGSGSV